MLVKWWLLAIPQYIVVAIFVGGGTWLAWQGDDRAYRYGGGLVGILVLIAVIALLFTGRYPRGIFDLVLGMNRWAVRVAAYAGLMTDRYPPFRLDLGGDEPGTVAVPDAEAPAPAGWTGGRIALVISGSLAALIAAALLAAGVAAVAGDQFARDGDGLPDEPGTDVLDVHVRARVREEQHRAAWPDSLLGTVQIRGTSARPLFIGVGPAAEVDRYLASVAHKEITDLRSRDSVVIGGNQRPAAPEAQGFWVATGRSTLRWQPQSGDWRAVVMNADTRSGVVADMSIGAELPGLIWVGIGLLAGGTALLAVAGLLLVGGARRRVDRPGPEPLP